MWAFVTALIGLAASGVALTQVETSYLSGQAVQQPYLQCANFAFTDGVQFPGLSGSTYRLPAAIIITLIILRYNPDFLFPIGSDSLYVHVPSISPTIDSSWMYSLHYGYVFVSPLTSILPLTVQNSTTFSVHNNDNVPMRWKFDVSDLTRPNQNQQINVTLTYDEFSEHYSTWTGGPLQVVSSNHNSRQLNVFLPVYAYSFQNATLSALYKYSEYHQRALQISYAILGGITS